MVSVVLLCVPIIYLLPYRSIDDCDECWAAVNVFLRYLVIETEHVIFSQKNYRFTNARCFRRAKISEEKYYIKIVYRTYAQAEWVSHRCRVRNSAPKTEFPSTLNPYTYITDDDVVFFSPISETIYVRFRFGPRNGHRRLGP